MITRQHVFAFVGGILFTVGGLAGAAKVIKLDATVKDLAHEVDLMGVKLKMQHPSSSAVEDEEPDLRRFSRRDTADNLYSPDDHAEFVGRRDSFDRRPSAAKGSVTP